MNTILNNPVFVSENISIASQIKLNGVNVDETGLRIIDNASMDCTFSISNTSQNSQSVTIILATYTQNGNLHNVEMWTKDIPANGADNIISTYEFDTKNEHSAKIMFWNSVYQMIPFRAKIEFNQNSGANIYYYDNNNRLLQVDKLNGTSLIYTYDNMGNMLTKTVRGEG